MIQITGEKMVGKELATSKKIIRVKKKKQKDKKDFENQRKKQKEQKTL